MITRLLLFIALSTTLLTTSCDKLTNITFEVRGAEAFFDLNPTDGPAMLVLTDEGIETNLRAELDANDVSTDRIEEIKVNSVTLSFEGTAGFDFSLVDRAKLSITAPGLSPVTIANDDLIGISTREVSLPVEDVEIQRYLESDLIDYILEVDTNAAVEESSILKVRVVFNVTGSIL